MDRLFCVHITYITPSIPFVKYLNYLMIPYCVFLSEFWKNSMVSRLITFYK